MKRSLLSLLVMVSVTTSVQAENLIEVYHQAQIKDPLLLESKARRDQAFEQINESRAALLPRIDVGAGVNYLKTTDDLATKGDANGSLTLGHSLYRRSNWLNLGLTEKAATRADVNYNFDAQQLMLRTSNAYFEVLRATDTLEFVRANKKAVERQLDQTRQRYEVGLSAITDVHEAQAERDQALADEINAENYLANSYETLRELTGIDYRSISMLNTQRFSPQKSAINSDQWLETALDKNLSLHSARISKDIAKQQIDLAASGLDPTLDLGAGLSVGWNEYKDDRYGQDGNMNQGNVGVKFAMPLFDGGKTNSQTKQAQFNYVAASEQLEKSYRSVQGSVRSYYNNVNASIGSIRAYSQSVVSAQSALTATEAGYEVGTRTIVDVLDATRKLYQAKQKLSGARYDYILNILNLKLTAGTLTEEDLVSINQALTNKTTAPKRS